MGKKLSVGNHNYNVVHDPPRSASTRVQYPACHDPVSSRVGVHPQYAARQADPPRPKAKPKSAPERAGERAAPPNGPASGRDPAGRRPW